MGAEAKGVAGAVASAWVPMTLLPWWFVDALREEEMDDRRNLPPI